MKDIVKQLEGEGCLPAMLTHYGAYRLAIPERAGETVMLQIRDDLPEELGKRARDVYSLVGEHLGGGQAVATADETVAVEEPYGSDSDGIAYVLLPPFSESYEVASGLLFVGKANGAISREEWEGLYDEQFALLETRDAKSALDHLGRLRELLRERMAIGI